MTQIGESVSVSMINDDPDEEAKKINKKPITLRISVFFDGTNNNRGNIQARKDNAPSYQLVKKQNLGTARPGQKPEQVGTSVASFEGEYTNVALLEEDFKATSGADYQKAFYIEGVGTRDLSAAAASYEERMRNYEAQLDAYETEMRYATSPLPPPTKPKFQTDSAVASAIATGTTGIYAKMESAFNQIVDWYSKLLESNNWKSSDYYISKIEVDIFGFSRGAATARSFIDYITSGEKVMIVREKTRSRGTRTKKIVIPSSNLLRRLASGGLEIASDALSIHFVGLFDTVSSYVWALNSDVSDLKLDAIKDAKKVYHLAAAEEHRLCFSLTDISSAKKNGGEEYYLPGVHSDIGGGYRELGAEIEDFSVLYRVSLSMAGFIRSIIDQSLEKFAKLLETEGWFYPDKLDPITHKPQIQTKYGLKVSVYRASIKNTYRRIPLNLMLEEAQRNGFSFGYLIQDDHQVPGELSQVDENIRSYIASRGSKSNENDWFTKNSDEAPGSFNIEALRNTHLHYSSRIAVGHWPRFQGGKRKREKYSG